MQIAPGVAALEVSAAIIGRKERIYPTLFWDEDGAMLVDAGYPGQEALIVAELDRHGVEIGRLRAILLSHQDVDHSGSAAALARLAPGPLAVISHVEEKPYIQREKQLRKFTPESVDRIVNALPAGMPEARRAAFRATLQNPPRIEVDRTVADGEELPMYGGIRIIGTPGHTPGHICLYHRRSGTLVVGDCLLLQGGELFQPPRWTCEDPDLAAASLRKLTGYDIRAVICYHGGLCAERPMEQIAELAAQS
jgi:glyoxylase-like metal-dependent hydrolase (beta-lactamase superfamily II)